MRVKVRVRVMVKVKVIVRVRVRVRVRVWIRVRFWAQRFLEHSIQKCGSESPRALFVPGWPRRRSIAKHRASPTRIHFDEGRHRRTRRRRRWLLDVGLLQRT